MMGNMRMGIGLLVLGVSASGCSEEVEDAKQAAAAASALMEAAKGAKERAEAAEEASKEAEKEALAKIPEGMDPEQAKQQVELAKGLAAMKAMGAGGPVVNWRQLQPFVPEKLGDFTAKGELDGATQKMGGAISVSTVKRRYTAGDRKLRVEVSDVSTAPMMKAPFAMVAMVEEDTSRGYKKGTKIDGHTAIVEWDKRSRRSKATLLVADRFIAHVTVDDTDADDEAQKVAGALDLDALSALKPEDEAQ